MKNSAATLVVTVIAIVTTLVLLSATPAEAGSRGAAKINYPEMFMPPFSNNANSNITDITTFKDISSLVRDDDKLYIAYFYDSLDINSIRLSTTMEEAAALLNGFAEFVALDIREPQLHWVMNAWSIQVVPAVKAITPRKHGRHSLGDSHPINSVGGIKQPVEYTGQDFNPESIKKFALQQLAVQPYIEKLNDQQYDMLLQVLSRKQRTPIVALFTDKDATSQLYKALALKFFGRVAFTEVFKGKSKKLVEEFQIKTFPTVLMFPSPSEGAADATKDVYQGKLNILELSAWVNTFAGSREEKQSNDRATELKQIQLDKQRAAQPIMQLKSIEHWMKLVLQSKSTVAVLFANPESDDTKSNLEALTKTKKSFGSGKKSKSPVGGYYWIDATTNSELANYFSKDSYADNNNVLTFISPKKGGYTKFVGAFEAEKISVFIKTQLGKGGSQYDVNELPNFNDETLV